MESLHFATEFHDIVYSDIEYFQGGREKVNSFLKKLFDDSCHTNGDDIYFDDDLDKADYIEINKSSFNKMLNHVRLLNKDEIVLTCDNVSYTAGEVQSILEYIRNNSPSNIDDVILMWYE